jgi:hypothetical protein
MMKIKLASMCIASLILVLGIGIAGDKANFSGKWRLDKDRSFSNPPGLDQTMTITHSGDQVKLEAQVKTQRGEQNVNESYTLDGKETEFKPANPNAKGKRIASWLPDGRGIMINDEASVDGKVVSQVTRKWTLSTDGKTLTADYFIDEQRGDQRISYESKRVFNKVE